MINCNLLNHLIRNFIIRQCVDFCVTSFATVTYDCIIKAIEMFSYLPVINSSVTTKMLENLAVCHTMFLFAVFWSATPADLISN